MTLTTGLLHETLTKGLLPKGLLHNILITELLQDTLTKGLLPQGCYMTHRPKGCHMTH